jgi:hypothetical protein
MKKELDEFLVKKYPKIFRDRYGDIRKTCMAWGFEIGDGWFNIIDAMCANIQGHINYSRSDRAKALKFNRALARAKKGDMAGLYHYHNYSRKEELSEYTIKTAHESLERGKERQVRAACPQVIATQVKEKFGTLRFYYDGGDEYVRAIENMADSMSARTCEVCGNPGKVYRDGWHSTLCPTHAKEQHREEEQDDV